jgi:predicted SprT family Zn-dependent metalloprotease
MALKLKRTRHPNRSYEPKINEPIAITPVEYGGLQEAYDHFNRELFDGKLPDVFITYQRKAHSAGYFSADRFIGRAATFGKHELALNPDGFIGQTDKQVCQTLGHEMHHVWQHVDGTPAARGYHNKEWAAKMKSNGLQPSSTGMVGGKETGQRMSDYIIPGGKFEQAFGKLEATGWKLNLQSAHRPGPKGTNNSKTKFTCASCGQNAWGKPDLAIICLPCGIQMRAADLVAAPQSYEPTTALPMLEPQSYEPIPSPSYDEPSLVLTEAEPMKRKRGRPKGSKNKPKEFDGASPLA